MRNKNTKLRQNLIDQFNSQNDGSVPSSKEKYKYLLTEDELDVIMEMIADLEVIGKMIRKHND